MTISTRAAKAVGVAALARQGVGANRAAGAGSVRPGTGATAPAHL
jgi:hypothetical protein